MRSARRRLHYSEKRLRWRSLSSYSRVVKAGPSPVGLCRLSVSERGLPLFTPGVATLSHSQVGKNADENNSAKDRRTIKRNRLVVFAAFLQFTDKLNVVPKGTPGPRTSFT